MNIAITVKLHVSASFRKFGSKKDLGQIMFCMNHLVVLIGLHAENQLPGWSGSGLKVFRWVGGGCIRLVKLKCPPLQTPCKCKYPLLPNPCLISTLKRNLRTGLVFGKS